MLLGEQEISRARTGFWCSAPKEGPRKQNKSQEPEAERHMGGSIPIDPATNARTSQGSRPTKDRHGRNVVRTMRRWDLVGGLEPPGSSVPKPLADPVGGALRDMLDLLAWVRLCRRTATCIGSTGADVSIKRGTSQPQQQLSRFTRCPPRARPMWGQLARASRYGSPYSYSV